MNSSPATEVTTEVRMYYDGIGISAVTEKDIEFFKYSVNVGKNLVEEKKQKGDTQTLGVEIKKEMDSYSLILKTMSPNTHPSKKHFEQMIQFIPNVKDKDRNFEYFTGLWVSNITALLELGVIENDLNNGPETIRDWRV